MKKLGFLALLVIMLVGVTGVINVGAQDVELIYWDTMNDQERVVMEEIVRGCETETGYTVIYEYVPFSNAQNQYKTAAQADEAPDILRTEIAWASEFASLGYLYDLTDLVTEEERASYLPAAFDYNVWHEQIWGFPQVTDAPALFYNKRLFEEAGLDPETPPATVEELQAAAEAISALGDDVHGIAQPFGAYAFQPFMWAFGGGLIDPDDLEIHIADQGTIDALNFVMSLMESGAMDPVYDPANQYGNSLLAFKEGKAGMYVNGPWESANVLSGLEFAETPENLGVAPFPAGPGGQGSPVGGHGYTVYAGSPFPEESVELIRCLNSYDNQLRLAAELNLVPTLLEVYADESLADNSVLQGFFAQMEVATNRPAIPAGGQIYTEFGPRYDAVILGDEDPQEAMDLIAAAWQTLLDSSEQ